ncbi:hypothetical protein [Cytobacillus sp. IB215316]|uniref:restriction endonuclease-related protein n=1 Tax=Cytobacillus sp. IB215316 TaxID=3097354 RepID=UPI002A0C1A63|nr:hypothetical protein [Cytobacillus sp. IB215316]MDX8359846.1 hypothetical protein [Cytobacillus sp. IB215316]
MEVFNKDPIDLILKITETLEYLDRHPEELPTYKPLKEIHTEIVKRYLSSDRRFTGKYPEDRNRELFPNNYQKLLKLFKTPLSQWGEGIFTKKDLNDLKLEDFCFLDDYGLTDDCHYIYAERKSRFEYQSSAVAKALLFCRQYEHQLDNAQQLYTKFRLFIQQHPRLTIKYLKGFMRKELQNNKLEDFLYGCYEPITNPDYVPCPRCDWTMKKITDSHYRCLTKDCEEHFDVRSTLGSLIGDGAELRTKKAVQLSTVISGLWEMELKTRLEKKGAIVQLYPNLERYGDLMIDFHGNSLFIDVKNYRSAFDLLTELKKEIERNKYHPSYTTIIAVPDNKSKPYIDFINKRLNTPKLMVLKFKEIEKWLTTREVLHVK